MSAQAGPHTPSTEPPVLSTYSIPQTQISSSKGHGQLPIAFAIECTCEEKAFALLS
jgi:hypothetical protein